MQKSCHVLRRGPAALVESPSISGSSQESSILVSWLSLCVQELMFMDDAHCTVQGKHPCQLQG